MHSFNICHFDIKLDNIGWSSTFQKLVFLDFGMTEIIDVSQGYKKLITFRGTYNYCSAEMKKFYHLKVASFVDTYWNDLHCF